MLLPLDLQDLWGRLLGFPQYGETNGLPQARESTPGQDQNVRLLMPGHSGLLFEPFQEELISFQNRFLVFLSIHKIHLLSTSLSHTYETKEFLPFFYEISLSYLKIFITCWFFGATFPASSTPPQTPWLLAFHQHSLQNVLGQDSGSPGKVWQMVVNFRHQLDYTMGCPDICSNIVLGVWGYFGMKSTLKSVDWI